MPRNYKNILFWFQSYLSDTVWKNKIPKIVGKKLGSEKQLKGFLFLYCFVGFLLVFGSRICRIFLHRAVTSRQTCVSFKI